MDGGLTVEISYVSKISGVVWALPLRDSSFHMSFLQTGLVAFLSSHSLERPQVFKVYFFRLPVHTS